MSRTITPATLLALALSLAIAIAVGRAADHEHEISIGKKGDFMFHQDMKVGEVTLPAGHYDFQHRVDGSEHYVQFTAMKGMHDGSGVDRRPSKLQDVGEVQCRVEPLDGKVKTTTIRWSKDGDGARIDRIDVKGETFAHVFK